MKNRFVVSVTVAMLLLAGNAGAQTLGAVSRRDGPIRLAIQKSRILGAVTAPSGPIQTTAPSKKGHPVIWGTVIGGVVGIVGGALSPTHSNGEYLVGGGRGQSALAVGAVGAGLGALVGAIIGARR